MHLALALLLATTATPLTPQQSITLRKVEGDLVAPCCYSQSIALHMSREAAEMRDQVTLMVEDGMTEQQIIDHYKAMYGERILTVPDGITGELAYTLPVLAVILGLAGLSLFIRQAMRPLALDKKTPHLKTTEASHKLILERIRSEVGESLLSDTQWL